jgi:hypothetical protein
MRMQAEAEAKLIEPVLKLMKGHVVGQIYGQTGGMWGV